MKEVCKKFCNKEVIMKILMFFIMIQPLLDIYILFEPNVVAFFKFSPSTIIRIVFVGLLSLLAIFTIKWTKKYIWILGYIGLVLLYTLLHHFNAVAFVSKVPGNFDYSLFSELFYIIRMLLPLIILFISYHLDFSKNKIEKIIFWLIILISGSIVVTNLLGISLSSYTNERISGTIIDWFSKGEFSYHVLSSKGFFMYANQIAALELLLTSILIYFFLKNPNIKNTFLMLLQLLACFMLGTKVAAIGFALLFICMILLYIFFTFIKKEIIFSKKILLPFGIMILLLIVLFPVSPMFRRNVTSTNIQNEFEEEITCQILEFDTSDPLHYHVKEDAIVVENEESCITDSQRENKKLEFLEAQLEKLETPEERETYLSSFLEKEFANLKIEEQFIKNSYPYQYDPYFWYDEVVKGPLSERMDYRLLEEKMLKHVKKINNNVKDDILGITYTRMSNIFNLERDFLSHYYSLGWFGVLLFLCPYLIILGVCIISIILHFKEKFTLYHCCFVMGIGICLFSAFYSGNVMDGLIVVLILGFIFGQFLRSVFEKNIVKDKKVSVIMPTYNDAESVIESIDSLRKQTYQNWELIVVDDGSTDNTKIILEEYIKKYDLKDKINYVYQENADQLKAIIHGTEILKGDYVFVLHSDDLLATDKVLEKAVMYMEKNQKLDAIIADLTIINEYGKITGKQRVLEYQKKRKIPVIQLLWLGRNLYVDVGFYKAESYVKQIKENYLIWNTPFWLTTKEKVEMLNIEKVDFEFIKYRVHSGNYINNEIGKLNVLNGELRVVTRLMKFYEIPNYQFQYKIFRVFSKLGLLNLYTPIYKKKETVNKAEILDFVIRKRFSEGYEKNIFLYSLVEFYRNRKSRHIKFSSLYKDEPIYKGNEMRKFNTQLQEKTLPSLYIKIMEEMKQGFDEIIVKNDEEYEKATVLVQFLCLYPYVKITKK